MFSCPDGFQRIANYQKLKFGKVKVVFVPSTNPDHFGGFPGFFLSSRESKNEVDAGAKTKTLLVAPFGTIKLLEKSVSFMGEYCQDLNVVELPQDLHSQPMEECKEGVLTYDDEHVIYKDELITIYPLVANGDGGVCYSYIGVPVRGNGKFLPQKALQLGCNPKLHFRTLSEGQSVTLPNGTEVHPSQVTDEPEAS